VEPNKTGAPEGALRTATIKHRQGRLIDDTRAFVRLNRGLLNPITEKFSDRATLDFATPAHKPADSDAGVGNGARCRMALGFILG
jgi:hypothetical protein